MSRNLLVVAGEASGDMYGAALVREIRKLDGAIETWGCGGDRMRGEGVEILYDAREFSVLGFTEVFTRIPVFLRALSRMKRSIEERKPSAVVLIDFPGFNLRLAGHAARLGVPVVYYVSPQVWAWGRGRVDKIRKRVDRMLVILPFEEEFYRESGVPVRFVGHPLIDMARPAREPGEFREVFRLGGDEQVIGLFPGSRSQEVESLLPVMTETVRRLVGEGFPVRPLIGAAPTIPDEKYRAILGGDEIPLVRDEAYDLLHASLFAFVASGTMTVEAACIGTPMAILYKVSPLSWFIGKRLVRVPHIGMANILAGERVAPELLQGEATAERLLPIAREWLADPARLEPFRKKLTAVRESLGGDGASRRAAEAVWEIVEGRGE